MTHMAWGKAKREVLALKVEITQMFHEGLTIEESWQNLESQLTSSRATFRRYASKIRKEAHKGTNLPTKAAFTYDPPATDEGLW